MTAFLLHSHATYSTTRAQKKQGCQLRECVWCYSLIDVTVRVSLLKEPRPYCSSLTHCPFTHMTNCVTHTAYFIFFSLHCFFTASSSFLLSLSLFFSLYTSTHSCISDSSRLQLSRYLCSTSSADQILVACSQTVSKPSKPLQTERLQQQNSKDWSDQDYGRTNRCPFKYKTNKIYVQNMVLTHFFF